jgi:hypothetical protein
LIPLIWIYLVAEQFEIIFGQVWEKMGDYGSWVSLCPSPHSCGLPLLGDPTFLGVIVTYIFLISASQIDSLEMILRDHSQAAWMVLGAGGPTICQGRRWLQIFVSLPWQDCAWNTGAIGGHWLRE